MNVAKSRFLPHKAAKGKDNGLSSNTMFSGRRRFLLACHEFYLPGEVQSLLLHSEAI